MVETDCEGAELDDDDDDFVARFVANGDDNLPSSWCRRISASDTLKSQPFLLQAEGLVRSKSS